MHGLLERKRGNSACGLFDIERVQAFDPLGGGYSATLVDEIEGSMASPHG
jgi:hypothetical protein